MRKRNIFISELKAANDLSGFSFEQDHCGALGGDGDGEGGSGFEVGDLHLRVAIGFGDEGIEHHVAKQRRQDEHVRCLRCRCKNRRDARCREREIIERRECSHGVA